VVSVTVSVSPCAVNQQKTTHVLAKVARKPLLTRRKLLNNNRLWQKKTVAAKKRNVKVGADGQLHVHSSFNNIIVCLANSEGQVISWSSAGKMGFRGSKKNTPYAAQMAAQDCAKVAYDLGLRKVKAYVKGPGNGRESAIRTIHGAGIEVTEIIDVTPLPHNGCRPPKRRRV
jgi:small subunit ribosomal protein S11